MPAPAARKVRLAAVHFVPRNAKTPEARREAFVPLIADAAKHGADLVVLPETLTYGSGANYAAVAEPVCATAPFSDAGAATPKSCATAPGMFATQ